MLNLIIGLIVSFIICFGVVATLMNIYERKDKCKRHDCSTCSIQETCEDSYL